MSDADDAVRGVESFALAFSLNGDVCSRQVPVQRTAADLLRDDLDLKGTRIGCSRGVCGACVALVDGVPSATCSIFAFQLQGRVVETIEGLQGDGGLHPIQQAFIDAGAFQCGYCTSGMVLLTKALLAAHPLPSREQVIEWISSNVCRCTGYTHILDAVLLAAKRIDVDVAP